MNGAGTQTQTADPHGPDGPAVLVRISPVRFAGRVEYVRRVGSVWGWTEDRRAAEVFASLSEAREVALDLSYEVAWEPGLRLRPWAVLALVPSPQPGRRVAGGNAESASDGAELPMREEVQEQRAKRATLTRGGAAGAPGRPPGCGHGARRRGARVRRGVSAAEVYAETARRLGERE